jgi:tRNA pseudouridine55 synthase
MSEQSPAQVRRPKRRDIDGVLLVDKPGGQSSNGVLQRVRFLLNAAKAGHGGTLDPMATGLLVVCFGEATKFSSSLLEGGKAYEGEMILGVRTDTGDAEGAVVETADLPAQMPDPAELARPFIGRIVQRPPVYSALKHEGKPLYEYARAGAPVEAKLREVTIYSLELSYLSADRIRFVVECSSGTYVRSLAEDISRSLGTVGHLCALRRIRSSAFRIDAATAPDALEQMTMDQREARLLLPDVLVADLPACTLDAPSALSICRGQTVGAPVGTPDGRLRLYDDAGIFLGVGTLEADGHIHSNRLLATESRAGGGSRDNPLN